MVGACVIVIDDMNRILLQLRADNKCWGLVEGSMEVGESLEEVAIRELKEETGPEAKTLELFNVFSGEDLYYKYPNGDEVYNVTVAYICRNYENELSIENNEVNDLRFFKVNKLPNNLSPPEKPIIESFMRILKLKNVLINDQ